MTTAPKPKPRHKGLEPSFFGLRDFYESSQDKEPARKPSIESLIDELVLRYLMEHGIYKPGAENCGRVNPLCTDSYAIAQRCHIAEEEVDAALDRLQEHGRICLLPGSGPWANRTIELRVWADYLRQNFPRRERPASCDHRAHRSAAETA